MDEKQLSRREKKPTLITRREKCNGDEEAGQKITF